jgi:hypothetical protein
MHIQTVLPTGKVLATGKVLPTGKVLATHWDAGAVSSKTSMGNHREEEKNSYPSCQKKKLIISSHEIKLIRIFQAATFQTSGLNISVKF